LTECSELRGKEVARRRKADNKTLPPNLYEGTNKYFKYRRPDNGKWYSMGCDRIKAVAAAKQLNSMLMVGRELVAKVTGSDTSILFESFLDQFESKIMVQKNLAAATIKEYKNRLVHVRKQLGKKPIDEISVKEIADFLDIFPPKTSNKYRKFLMLIFKHAIAKGLCHDNPAEKTLSYETVKTRKRLSLEGYLAIYEKAESWLKNAMDIAALHQNKT
jgi:hypothetical protein